MFFNTKAVAAIIFAAGAIASPPLKIRDDTQDIVNNINAFGQSLTTFTQEASHWDGSAAGIDRLASRIGESSQLMIKAVAPIFTTQQGYTVRTALDPVIRNKYDAAAAAVVALSRNTHSAAFNKKIYDAWMDLDVRIYNGLVSFVNFDIGFIPLSDTFDSMRANYEGSLKSIHA